MTAASGNINIPGEGEVPLDTSVGWKRIAASATDHRLFGVDDSQPALLYLTSPALQVTGGDFRVSLQARWSLETDASDPNNVVYYDGAVVEVSADNGTTWTDVGASATPGYAGVLYDQSGNPLSGKNAFVGTNPSWPDFDPMVIDLGTAYEGKTVLLRFSVGSDAAASAYGMELDDIAFNAISNTPFDSVVGDRHVCESNPPVAKLTGPSVVTSGQSYVLDGSSSVSTHGAPLTFTWTQLAGPQTDLSDPTTSKPSFTAPDVGGPSLVTFQLVVNDGTSNGYPVTTTFTVLPAAPKAQVQPAAFKLPGAASGGCNAGGASVELLALAALVLFRRKKR
jgi:Synergist-CTERM protein sorting domain-containing protein